MEKAVALTMKKSLIPKVFISYCWEDIDRELLDYLIFILNDTSESKYEIIYDQKSRIGDDIQEFMQLLKVVDAVVIICTPGYKKRIINRQKSGVYTEFKLILERYNEIREFIKPEELRPFFDVLPVHLSGSRQDAIPDEISTILSESLLGLYPAKDKSGNYIIPQAIKATFLSRIDNIGSRIKAINAIKKESYKESWKELFKLLFKESKAEWHKPESRKYVDQVFVKTSAYKKVRDQDIWFLIGRKGSGKTTLTDILPILHAEKFFIKVKIEAEDIYLQTIYNLFDTSAGFDSDTKFIYPRTKVLQFGWEVFIILASMYFLVQNGGCTDPAKKKRLVDFLEDLLNRELIGSDFSDLNTFFNHSFIQLQNFIDKPFKEAREDKFGADLASHFSIGKFRDYVISKDIHDIFLTCLKDFNDNILLSFDGFDSVFNEFRKESLLSGDLEEFNKRSDFEVNWLSALILLVLNQGVSRHAQYPLYNKFYYCITIPKDRFIEIQKKDRDTFRHFNKFSYLKWTGIELAILLRKRMEELSSIYTEVDDRVEKRLRDIFEKGFPNLPYYLEFSFNQQPYRIPLFIYVLRHTFWRPRDILFYFTGILSLNREFSKKGEKISSEAIRTIVKRTTFKVIESEFINEFDTTIVNFSAVIYLFKGSLQILSFQDISRIIGNVDFQKQTSLETIKSIHEKIYFLFNVGFLGVIFPDEMQKEYSIMKYAFSFNEGDFAIKKFDESTLQSVTFIIHPIFCEYLSLDTSMNGELVMNYTWEYLHNQEAFNNIDI